MTADVTLRVLRKQYSVMEDDGLEAKSKWLRAREMLLTKRVEVRDIKDSMEQMKDWILHKCKSPVINAPSSGFRSNLANVVTPDSIPQFMIPGQEIKSNTKDDSFVVSESSSQVPMSTSAQNFHTNFTHTRSAPVTPCGNVTYRKSGDINSSESFDCISEMHCTTNADPRSQLATSLPHFRTQTSYGLTTVSQNPHTRRKESLFHILQNNEGTESQCSRSQIRKKCHSLDEAQVYKVNTTSAPGTPVMEIRNKSRKSTSSLPRTRRRQVNYIAAPLGVVGSSSSLEAHSAGESPHYSSPSTPELQVRSPHAKNSPDRSNYYRRRTSLALARTAAECSVCNKATSTSDDSSDDNCRSSSRSKFYRRRSSANADQSGPICHSCILNRLQARLMAELGELKLSIEYREELKQLKVLLIRAENLGGRMQNDDNMSTFAKVCLMPAKHHKRVTKVVKHTSDPVFDEMMNFNGVEKNSLKEMTLKVKVMQKTHNLKSERLIGQVLVDLGGLDLSKELRMWKDLQPKDENEDLGRLDVTVRFEPKEERLCVAVNSAKRLRNHTVTGPPDAYVKVTVRQPGRSQMKKSTVIRKNAINPVFGESFVFPISPKIEDLNYAAVTLTVYDHTKLRSDVPIGQVRLGHRSTEECEFEHWNQVLQHPGQDYTWVHTLMDPREDK